MKLINDTNRPSSSLLKDPTVEHITYPISSQPNRAGLSAKWDIVDGKLVCKWNIV